MVAAIRQTLNVQTDGVLEVRSAELRAGDVAEVIVLMPQREPGALTASLDELQRKANLTPQAAAEWVDRVRSERQAPRG